jgi:hypothetical protein
MGFVLFYIAWILHLILRVLFSWYKPIYFISRNGFVKGIKKWNTHMLHQAMAEDQAANVSLFMLLNKFFTKGEATFNYGDEDDTISYASAMAYHKGGKKGPATALVKFLRFVDKDHDIKSINAKIVRDLEAANRLKQAGVIKFTELLDINNDTPDSTWELYVHNINNTEREIKI